MIKKLLNWIRRKEQPSAAAVGSSELVVPPGGIHPDNVEHEDAFAREMIARCWNSGKMVIANRDEEGNVNMSEHDIK